MVTPTTFENPLPEVADLVVKGSGSNNTVLTGDDIYIEWNGVGLVSGFGHSPWLGRQYLYITPNDREFQFYSIEVRDPSNVSAQPKRLIRTCDDKFVYTARMNVEDWGTYQESVRFFVKQYFVSGSSEGTAVETVAGSGRSQRYQAVCGYEIDCSGAPADHNLLYFESSDSTWKYSSLKNVGGKVSTGFPFDPNTGYDVTLSYSSVTRQVTITPVSDTFTVWIDGLDYVFTGPQVSDAHADVSGGYFVYYNENGVLTTTSTPWDLLKHAPVASITYNATAANSPFVLLELHTSTRDPQLHRRLHFGGGTQVSSRYGFPTIADDGPTFTSTQIEILDEDIELTVPALDDGFNRVVYRLGSLGEFTVQDLTFTGGTYLDEGLPFLTDGTYISWNEWTGATWQITPLSNNYYVNMWLCACTEIDETKRYFIVPGQAEFATLEEAQNEDPSNAISWGDAPPEEFVIVAQITYQRQTSNGANNHYADIKGTQILAGNRSFSYAAGVTSHDGLSGRNNDDNHTQYLLISGTRAMTGDLAMGSNAIDGCTALGNTGGNLNIAGSTVNFLADTTALFATTSGNITITPGGGTVSINGLISCAIAVPGILASNLFTMLCTGGLSLSTGSNTVTCSNGLTVTTGGVIVTGSSTFNNTVALKGGATLTGTMTGAWTSLNSSSLSAVTVTAPSTTLTLNGGLGATLQGSSVTVTGLSSTVTIQTSFGNSDIVLSPHGTGRVDVSSSIIENVSDGTASGHAINLGQLDGRCAPTITVGTSFPLSPSDGDKCYRTDLQRWYIYFGTRGHWLTEEVAWFRTSFNSTALTNSNWLRRENGTATNSAPLVALLDGVICEYSGSAWGTVVDLDLDVNTVPTPGSTSPTSILTITRTSSGGFGAVDIDVDISQGDLLALNYDATKSGSNSVNNPTLDIGIRWKAT